MKHFLILTWLLLFLTISTESQLSAQISVDLFPDFDAAIGYHDGFNTASNNYGTAIQNAAFCIPASGNSGENRNRSLIHFDLTQIPANARVISATMDLYALGPFGNLPGHVGTNNATGVFEVTQAWQEMVVSWNNQPSFGPTPITILGSTTNPLQDYLGINVTNAVQQMVSNSATNFGFGLKLQNEIVSNGLSFASNDHSDTAKRPRLHVIYCVDSLNFFAIDDAAIGSHSGLNTNTQNYSNAPQFAAYCIRANNNTPSGNLNRALMHFDFSSISPSTTIASARLELYARGPSGTLNGHTGNANSSGIWTIATPWDATTVTWDNQPNTLNQVATLQQSTSSTQDYLNIDVTSAVRDIVSGASANNGFMLKLITEIEENGLIFQSLDCGDPSKFARIIVSFGCDTITAIEEESLSLPEVAIFPNPTNGDFQVKMNLQASTEVNVDLFDLQGRVVYHKDFGIVGSGQSNLNLDDALSKQPSGNYFVKIMIGNNSMGRIVSKL